ncbi:MAG: hypothetical protein FJ110_09615 [Deltaproteobacteria bacterium]|nr:hypothetical protein [Deltaproteobacteria bacterium]
MTEELRDLKTSGEEKHKEIMDQFRTVRVELSGISFKIEGPRNILIESLEDLAQKNISMEKRLELYEQAHEDFDRKLLAGFVGLRDILHKYQETMKFSQGVLREERFEYDLKASSKIAPQYLERRMVSIPPPEEFCYALLDGESRSFLEPIDFIHDMVSSKSTSFDYAVCAIGLWKALELELNITFIGWLRKRLGISEEYQTIGKGSKKPAKEVMIYSGPGKGLGGDYYVNINETETHNHLRSVMLNPISYILQYAEKNQLAELLNNGLRPYKDDIVGHKDGDRWCGLPNDIRKVTRDYRNSHAHTKKMTRKIFEEFREYMFGADDPLKPGVLPRVLQYKKIITQPPP